MEAAEWVEKSLLKRPLTPFQRDCVNLLCRARASGPYNFARTFERADWEFGSGVRFVVEPHNFSTYDGRGLTALVIGAHDLRIRVEIAPVNFRYIAVMMHPRQATGKLWERHPTIEQAIAEHREGRR